MAKGDPQDPSISLIDDPAFSEPLPENYVVFTPCSRGLTPLYFEASGVSQFIGETVRFNGTCYTVEESFGRPAVVEPYAPSIDLSNRYISCAVCTGGTTTKTDAYYQFAACDGSDTKYFSASLTNDPYAAFVGKVVSWAGKCWTVTPETNPSVVLEEYYPNITEVHLTCEECSGADYYQLTACNQSETLYATTAGLADGATISWNGKCFFVTAKYGAFDLIALTEVSGYITIPGDCTVLECAADNDYWKLSNCSVPTVAVYVNEAAELVEGKTYKYAGGCYTATKVSTVTAQTEVILPDDTQQFDSCADCQEGTVWSLQDCDDPESYIHIEHPVAELTEADHLGRIVRVNINNKEECFLVSKALIPLSAERYTAFPGVLLETHTSCVDCQTSGIEVPTFEELPTVFDIDFVNCCNLKLTNLTVPMAGHSYDKAYDPELIIETPSAVISYIDEHVDLSQATAVTPFNLLTPSVAFETNTAHINRDIDDYGIAGESLGETFEDGIYHITFAFKIGSTQYTTKQTLINVCNGKACLAGLIDAYLSASDCKENAELRKKIENVRLLIEGAELDVEYGNYGEAQAKIAQIAWMCQSDNCEDCGCGC